MGQTKKVQFKKPRGTRQATRHTSTEEYKKKPRLTPEPGKRTFSKPGPGGKRPNPNTLEGELYDAKGNLYKQNSLGPYFTRANPEDGAFLQRREIARGNYLRAEDVPKSQQRRVEMERQNKDVPDIKPISIKQHLTSEMGSKDSLRQYNKKVSAYELEQRNKATSWAEKQPDSYWDKDPRKADEKRREYQKKVDQGGSLALDMETKAREAKTTRKSAGTLVKNIEKKGLPKISEADKEKAKQNNFNNALNSRGLSTARFSFKK